jgi:hypothetical protein
MCGKRGRTFFAIEGFEKGARFEDCGWRTSNHD